MDLLILLVFVVGFAFLLAVGRRERARRREAAETVTFVVNDWGVKRTLADGRREEVSWTEVNEVRLTTLPKGPWGDRVRVILDGGGERGCIVPYETAYDGGLVDRVTALPGFDHRTLAEVLDKPQTGTVVVWARTASHPEPSS
ncbi:MAG TPA: hypothetical protein VGJ03_00110 [Acidimicrobiales bacterium]|jgi:hypothetical protein